MNKKNVRNGEEWKYEKWEMKRMEHRMNRKRKQRWWMAISDRYLAKWRGVEWVFSDTFIFTLFAIFEVFNEHLWRSSSFEPLRSFPLPFHSLHLKFVYFGEHVWQTSPKNFDAEWSSTWHSGTKSEDHSFYFIIPYYFLVYSLTLSRLSREQILETFLLGSPLSRWVVVTCNIFLLGSPPL